MQVALAAKGSSRLTGAARLAPLLDADRRAEEAELFAQTIHQVALVGEVQFRFRCARRSKDDKRRRARAGLRDVENADRVLGARRGARLFQVALEEAVQL